MAAAYAGASAPVLRVTVRARPIWSGLPGEWASVGELVPYAEFTRVVGATLHIDTSAPPHDLEASWQLGSAFERPAEALAAAIEVQHATRSQPRRLALPWHAAAVVSVEAEPVTAALEECHGGQVLLTDAAYEALRHLGQVEYYRWDQRAGGLWECGYDTPLGMLDAPFERMFAAEVHEWILPRRTNGVATGPTRAGREASMASPYAPDVQNDLFAVALSGGGMRSATFSLGVLQALARNELLAGADYIASVSGGGYIGAALAGLGAEELPYEGLDRLGADYAHFPFAFPQALMQGAERPRSLIEAETSARRLPVHGNEAPALWHIRKHANLLGSGIGIFDLTTWLSVGRYLASTLALWLFFLLPVLGVAAAAAIGVWLVIWDHSSTTVQTLLVLAPLIFGGVLLLGLGALVLLYRGLPRRVRLLRVLRAVTFAEGLALVALIVGGSAWLIEHGVSWYAEVTTSGTLFGGVLAAAGSRLLKASSQWKALAARLMLQFGGLLLLGGIAVWSVWFAAYLFGAMTPDPRLPVDAGYIIAAFAVLTALAIALLVLSLSSAGFARGLLNWLSLHDLYETRIQQAWIITARKRVADAAAEHITTNSVARWTDVWPAADLTVGSLRAGGDPRMPYPLLCATLSLPASRGDKLPERKSDSFVIGPVFTGSALTRWSRTTSLPEFEEMPLARATAISGAVISPNMGEHTSTSLAIITTLLNIRIGRWVLNPRPTTQGRIVAGFNRVAHVLYFREMLGLANREDASVYLSDGGHFDNLGVYELFRRRCRFIIAVSSDLEAEHEPDKMGNLGNALRMARVDFGVEVTLGPLRPLLRDSATGRVVTQYLVGRIRYPHMPVAARAEAELRDSAARQEVNSGTFVFIKCGIVDDALSPDLLQYLGRNPAFPYDSTSDQQFDQPQFESYRQLGFLAAQAMFDQHPAAADQTASVEARFAALHPTPPAANIAASPAG